MLLLWNFALVQETIRDLESVLRSSPQEYSQESQHD